MSLARILTEAPSHDTETRTLAFRLSASSRNTGAKELQGRELHVHFMGSKITGGTLAGAGNHTTQLQVTERDDQDRRWVLEDDQGRVRAILRLFEDRDAEVAINHPANIYELGPVNN